MALGVVVPLWYPVPCPEIDAVVGVVSEVAEPEVVLVADLEVYALLSEVAEPLASVDISVAFAVVAPFFVVAAEVDSCGRPRSSVFPNTD